MIFARADFVNVHHQVESKTATLTVCRKASLKYWEIIADNLSKADWSWGCLSAIDSNRRTIWIADAHRGDRNRFVVQVDEKLTAFLELESATRGLSPSHL
ncbi:MAG: hypothetical protein DME33_02735 [Verrucomicrobia bacterium]|nr:MAG: hypothetical protein DME33_02735 [Verrucomicrobiota bacterium]